MNYPTFDEMDIGMLTHRIQHDPLCEELVYFPSATVLFGVDRGKVAVVYSPDKEIDNLQIHLYNSRDDYADQKATALLGRYTDYMLCLKIAANWLGMIIV